VIDKMRGHLYYCLRSDTNGIFGNDTLKMDSQYNGQKKKDKRTENDLQNTTQKTKE
jgi:hypothetical protein